ncbi:MAG: DUF2156 domain-containing protein, partial [Algicola sp.]|nr:DUF2156 domain-containing protein [Algicola sp.]
CAKHNHFLIESTVSRASDLIAPYLFIDLVQYCYFKLNLRDNVILVYSYVGPQEQYHALIAKLAAYANANGYSLNLLSYERLETVEDMAFSSTPLGALQRITDIQSFSLAGGKKRRLRSAVNKFVSFGDCHTDEHTVGSDQALDDSIIEMIDLWCAKKSHVNPTVAALKEQLQSGSLDSRHRVFLTYSCNVLQSVILMTWMPEGYLMDMEFYAEASHHGSQEFTIVEIIKLLASEGNNIFSLGGTIGPEMVESPNPDTATREVLQGLRERGDFGAGNWQFKNKFGPQNQAFYLCQPVGVETDIFDILMMMSDPKPLDEAEIDLDSVLAEAGFNPILVDSKNIKFDLMTDSWAQLHTDYVRQHVSALQQPVSSSEQMIQSLKQIIPFEHVLAVKSGRAAEAVFYKSFGNGKGLAICNLLFPTNIFSQLGEGYTPVECPDAAVFDVNSTNVFKGNLDVMKLSEHLNEASKIAYVCIETSVNAAGGYAVSLDNLKTIKKLTTPHNIPLVMDITRIVENAHVIQQHEAAYAGWAVWQIVKEICAQADCITASLCKDFGVTAGGIVATNNEALYQAMLNKVDAEEAALNDQQISLIANNLADTASIESRVSQRLAVVKSVWTALEAAKVPVVKPSGTHSVLIDVMQIAEFASLQQPLPSFLAWLYSQTGVRAGVHSVGMQKNTVLNGAVRLAIPVGLTLDDAKAISAVIINAFNDKQSINALEVIEASKQQFGELKTTYRVTAPVIITNKKPNEPLVEKPNNDIAIVGLAGRYPKANNMTEFWDNLINDRDCISEVSRERWDHNTLKGDDKLRQGAKWGGFMDDVDKFDAGFFSIDGETAQNMTPEERLFMQIAWETLEDAGYSPQSLIEQSGAENIGVFAGVVWSQYEG